MQTNSFPGGEGQQQNGGTGNNENAGGEDVQISPPQIDRPEGPFEHSGETSGWTEEERKEVEDEEQSS